MTSHESGAGSGAGLSLDTVLKVMANKHRRRLLLRLLDHNPQDDEDIDALADHSLSDDELADFRIHMTHRNLPKLVDAGVIEWDQAENVVTKGPRFDDLRPLLELMQAHADELPDDWL
jgi:predicted transcriptional regulator